MAAEEIVPRLAVETTQDYVADIKQILLEARRTTARAVNHLMVQAYWLVGRRIMEEEQHGEARAEYGEKVLTILSRELVSEFGDGFSYASLRNMRQFYRTFPDPSICYTLCSKLSWSHNRLIMRVDGEQARMYYLREAAEQQWSVRQLERNIQSHYYQRIVANQEPHRPELSMPSQTQQFFKDPYVLEFVGLRPHYSDSEKGLEAAIIDNLQQFMLELGKGFSFVGRQYRISTETTHFYIDLVFYNYLLKCFVLIDLKTHKLTHQDIGQMDMYVRMFDDMKRPEGDNPTIGMLLCAERDETVVKYSVLGSSKQLFATKYLPYFPTEEELRDVIPFSRTPKSTNY